MSEKVYYHATPIDNMDSIDDSGHLEPGIDGCVHFTTSLDRAMLFMETRGVDHFAVYTADMYFTNEANMEPFSDGTASGDDCYIHEGRVAVELFEAYSPPPAGWTQHA